MIKAGFEIVDSRTGSRTRVVEGTAERNGMGWVLEVECPAGVAPRIVAHVHTGWIETFEILRGSARYRLNGVDGTASTGDVILMPAGQPHVHPWNAADGPMVYRQTNQFDRPTPDAVDDVIGVFATLSGLGREGKLGSRGLPKNPLQFAATLRTLVKHGGYDAAVPIPVQRFLSATVGRFAEALGYRAVYPRFVDGGAADFATRYAAAWSSQDPASLAAFYAEDGSLTVNDGTPSVGRAAIAATAQEFMSAFPDMVVVLDEVSQEGTQVIFRWIWTGTNTGPGGTGSAVRIKGYEEWTIGAEGLIVESKGHYDEAEYQRQLQSGIAR